MRRKRSFYSYNFQEDTFRDCGEISDWNTVKLSKVPMFPHRRWEAAATYSKHTCMHPTVCTHVWLQITLQPGMWLHGVHRMWAVMTAVSCGTSQATTKQHCKYTASVDIYLYIYNIFQMCCVSKTTDTHTESHATSTKWVCLEPEAKNSARFKNSQSINESNWPNVVNVVMFWYWLCWLSLSVSLWAQWINK